MYCHLTGICFGELKQIKQQTSGLHHDHNEGKLSRHRIAQSKKCRAIYPMKRPNLAVIYKTIKKHSQPEIKKTIILLCNSCITY